jgi:hypothetical protein
MVEVIPDLVIGFGLGFCVRHLISLYRRSLERERYLANHPYLKVTGYLGEQRVIVTKRAYG